MIMEKYAILVQYNIVLLVIAFYIITCISSAFFISMGIQK